MLARRLSGDPEPGSYLWPPDALVDGIVEKRGEVRLCLVADSPCVLDLFKYLGCRPVGDLSRRACGFC